MNELGIPYDTQLMDFGDLKKDPFESVNPNGRVPAIEDPNTGLKLWESGAIIEYLLETYDTGNSLSYSSGSEKWEQKCWLHFQTSGQGPYFGQRAWFVLVRTSTSHFIRTCSTQTTNTTTNEPSHSTTRRKT